MAEAYLVFEISQFSSYYFGDDVPSMRRRRRCNEDDNNQPQMQPIRFLDPRNSSRKSYIEVRVACCTPSHFVEL